MVKLHFAIYDLGSGGAEKVLVNLINRLDRDKYDIFLTAIFGGGVNEKRLAPHIHYRSVVPRSIRGCSHIMKLFSPSQLYRLFVKEDFDVDIAYLEAETTRFISGGPDKNKRIAWIHGEQDSLKQFSSAYHGIEEMNVCYDRFDRVVCVADSIRKNVCALTHFSSPVDVLYNTIESDVILTLSEEPVDELMKDNTIKIVTTGTLKAVKGFDRLLRIVKKLHDEDSLPIHLYILGKGPDYQKLEQQILEANMTQYATMLGYQENPYKYVAKSDVFVCSSYREGFSTAATEALIVGTPVVTTLVSGMREMLGENNEYGIITENNEDALYEGLKGILSNSEVMDHYRRKAAERGKLFDSVNTVKAVEELIDSVTKE